MRAGERVGNKNLLHGVFSFSKLNTYAKCPQRAKFRYVDGRKESGLHLARGRAAHAGQEIDNRAKLRGENLPVGAILEAAVEVLRTELEQEPELQDRPASKGREIDTFKDNHSVHLDVFEDMGERARILPLPGTIESTFEMDWNVEGKPALIQGFVDLLSEYTPVLTGDPAPPLAGGSPSGEPQQEPAMPRLAMPEGLGRTGPGRPVVVDYKTVKRPVSVRDAEKSLQFELYRLAAGAGSVRVVSFVEAGRQRATTKVVETPPRPVGEAAGPAAQRLMNWMAKTISSFRRSLETGDWPRCSPESYWCSASACGFFGECYPKRVPGLDRLVVVEGIRGPGTLPQPEWRETYGGVPATESGRSGDPLGSAPRSGEPGEGPQGSTESSGLVGEKLP